MKLLLLFFFSIFLSGCKSSKVIIEKINKTTDLTFYDNGFVRTIGQIETEYLSKAARIGLWSEFYETGRIKETGEFKVSFYINCCTSGQCDVLYSYKAGEWKYYYENGQLMATGNYDIKKKKIETSCGSDNINFGYINDSWKFFDEKGNKITISKKEIIEIEEGGILTEFDINSKISPKR